MSYPKIGLTLGEITAEVRAVNIEKGWRPPEGGPSGNTFGDYIALAHSELSEALEAYRDHRLADATPSGQCAFGECDVHPHKPEGVGSEMADVLIRLVDMCDMFGIDLEAEYRRKVAYNRTRPFQHGGRTLAEDKPAVPHDAEAHLQKVTYNSLYWAMPTAMRGWWMGSDVDAFTTRWETLGLPHIETRHADMARVTLWCADMAGAAEKLGVAGSIVDGRGFEICRNEYSVAVVQAEKKETKDA